jgi:hypothetical protein
VEDWQGLYDALQAVRNKVLDALDKLERKKPLIKEAMADCNEADQRLMDMQDVICSFLEDEDEEEVEAE